MPMMNSPPSALENATAIFSIFRGFTASALRSKKWDSSRFANVNASAGVTVRVFIVAVKETSLLLRPDYGGTGNCAKKSHGISGKPDDDAGFAALAHLESRRVALGSPPQSLGKDAQTETA